MNGDAADTGEPLIQVAGQSPNQQAPDVAQPSDWATVKKTPEYQALTPQDQMVAFSRWHDNASNYYKGQGDWWAQNGDKFNNLAADEQKQIGQRATASAMGLNPDATTDLFHKGILTHIMTPDEARYHVAAQAKNQNPDAQLPPDLEKAFQQGPGHAGDAELAADRERIQNAQDSPAMLAALAHGAATSAVGYGAASYAAKKVLPSLAARLAFAWGTTTAAAPEEAAATAPAEAGSPLAHGLAFGAAELLTFIGTFALSSKLMNKGEEALAPHSETVRQMMADVNANPKADFIGGLLPFAPSAVRTLGAYQKIAQSPEAVSGVLKALAQDSSKAAVAAGVQTVASPVMDQAFNQVGKLFGMTPDEVQKPGVKDFLTNFGMLLAFHRGGLAKAGTDVDGANALKGWSDEIMKTAKTPEEAQTMLRAKLSDAKLIREQMTKAYANGSPETAKTWLNVYKDAIRPQPEPAAETPAAAAEPAKATGFEHLSDNDLAQSVENAKQAAASAPPEQKERWADIQQRLNDESTARAARQPAAAEATPAAPTGPTPEEIERGRVDKNAQAVKTEILRQAQEKAAAEGTPSAAVAGKVEQLVAMERQRALQETNPEIREGYRLAHEEASKAVDAMPGVDPDRATHFNQTATEQPPDLYKRTPPATAGAAPRESTEKVDGPVLLTPEAAQKLAESPNGRIPAEGATMAEGKVGQTHADLIGPAIMGGGDYQGEPQHAFRVGNEIVNRAEAGKVATAAGQRAEAPEVPLQSQMLREQPAEVGAAKRVTDAKQALASTEQTAREEIEDKFFGPKGIFYKIQDVHFDPANPKEYKKAIGTAVKDIEKFVKENPHFQNYYSQDMKTLRALMDKNLPRPLTDDEFKVVQFALGATSPNTMLSTNVLYALKVGEAFQRDGDLSKVVVGEAGKSQKEGDISLLPTHAKMLQLLGAKIKELGGVQPALDWFQQPVGRADLDAAHIEAGYGKISPKTWSAVQHTTEAATGQKELIPRVFAFGNKAGAYTLNHLGDFRYNTTDKWESRFIRSYFPAMFEKATGIPLASEHEMFARFGKDFKIAWEKKYGETDNAGLQALRWYFVLTKARELGYPYARTSETISKYAEKHYTQGSGALGGKLGNEGAAATGEEAGTAAGQPAAGSPATGVGLGTGSGASTNAVEPFTDEKGSGFVRRAAPVDVGARAPLTPAQEEILHSDIQRVASEVPDVLRPGLKIEPALKASDGGGSPIWVKYYDMGGDKPMSKEMYYNPRAFEASVQESMRSGFTRDEAIRELFAQHELVHWNDNVSYKQAVEDGLSVAKNEKLARMIADNYIRSSLTGDAREKEIQDMLDTTDKSKMVALGFEAVEQLSRMRRDGTLTEDMFRQMPKSLLERMLEFVKRQVRILQGNQSYEQLTDAMKKRVDDAQGFREMLEKYSKPALQSITEGLAAGAPSIGQPAGQAGAAKRELTPDEVAHVNKTARAGGAVGANAITPKYVADTIKPGESVLNFGAGKPDASGKYGHSEQVAAKGAKVDNYDIGANATGEATPHDTVMASNVLNVQPDEATLRGTLQKIKDAVSPGGRAVMNFPDSPNKSSMSAAQVESIIKEIFGADPQRVGGTKSAPLWEVRPTAEVGNAARDSLAEGARIRALPFTKALNSATRPGEIGGMLNMFARDLETKDRGPEWQGVAAALRRAAANMGESYNSPELIPKVQEAIKSTENPQDVADALREIADAREQTGRQGQAMGFGYGGHWIRIAGDLRTAADAIDKPNVIHANFGGTLGAAPRSLEDFEAMLKGEKPAAPAPAPAEGAPVNDQSGGISNAVQTARGTPQAPVGFEDAGKLVQDGKAAIAKGASADTRVAELVKSGQQATPADFGLFFAHALDLQKASNESGVISPEEKEFAAKIQRFKSTWALEGHVMAQMVQGDDWNTLMGVKRAFLYGNGRELKPAENKLAADIASKSKKATDTITTGEANLIAETRAKGPADANLPKDAQGIVDLLKRTYGSAEQVGAATRWKMNIKGMSPEHIRMIQAFVKDNYLSGQDYTDPLTGQTRKVFPPVSLHDIVEKVTNDLSGSGLKSTDIMDILAAQTRFRNVSNEIYAARAEQRLIQNAARMWIENPDQTTFTKVLDTLRQLTVLGHANAPTTHAGENWFVPYRWRDMVWASKKSFEIIGGNKEIFGGNAQKAALATNQRMLEEMVESPNYLEMVRNGLEARVGVNDQVANYMTEGYLGKLGFAGVGVRGNLAMEVLKPLRVRIGEYELGRLNEEERNDPDTVRTIMQEINNETGIVTTRGSGGTERMLAQAAGTKLSQRLLFAGKLEASRVMNRFVNPVKAAQIYVKQAMGQDVSLSEKAFARMVVRRNAWLMGVYTSGLAANAAVLSFLHKDDKINVSNPFASDFAAFKWGGNQVAAPSNFMSPVRLLLSVVGAPFVKEEQRKGVWDRLQAYATGKLNPGVNDLAEILQGKQSFGGRPLPWMPATKTKEPISYTEYLSTKLPIPLAQAATDYYDALRDSGVNDKTSQTIMNTSLGLVSGLMGVHAHPEAAKPPKDHLPWQGAQDEWDYLFGSQ